jgi:malate permease and related proteins
VQKMGLFVTTFESVAVLLGIGVLGFWIIRRRILPGDILGFLSPLALDIALPCLIFANIVKNFSPGESPGWWQLPLWCLFFIAVAGALTFLATFIAARDIRREFAISLFYQNAIFFPLAIIAGMHGDESPYLVFLFLFTIFYPAFFFSTYHFFFQTKGNRTLDWRKIIHPVLLVTLGAITIRLAGAQDYIPGFIVSAISMVGGMTVPLIMLILGGNIYLDFQKKGALRVKEVIKFVVIKNIVFPFIFLGIILIIRPAYPVALLLLLQSAIPPVTAVPLVTERCGGNRAVVDQFMLASFLFSLVSVSVMVSLFSMFFHSP